MRRQTIINLGGSSYYRGSYHYTGKYNVTNNALTGLFTRLDRTLGGGRHKKLLVVSTPDSKMPAPSSTNGQMIQIVESAITEAIRRRGFSMLTLFGLNYHELAHVLYTPRLNATERVWASVGIRHQIINILEDLRIEHMIRQQYDRMTVYFMAMVHDYIMNPPVTNLNDERVRAKNGENVEWFKYALLCERRYIPREDREHYRELMVKEIGESQVSEVEDICQRWVRMTSLTNQDFLDSGQKQMVDRLADILSKGQAMTNMNGQKILVAVIPCSSEAHQDDRKPSARKVDKYEHIEGDDEPGEEGDGQGEGEDDSAGQGGEPEDGKDGSPAGRGYSRTGSGRATFDAVYVAIDTDVNVKRDLAIADREVERAEFKLPEVNKALVKPQKVTAEMRRARDKFAREVEQLVKEADPGWEKYQSTGRLNMARAMREEDPTTVFDAWDDDRSEATRITAYLLGDMSGSMQGDPADQASQAMWIIGSALKEHESPVQTFGFSDQTWALNLPFKDNEYSRLASVGGTNPRVGIAKARYELEQEEGNRLFIIYTDGQWFDADDDKDIDAMNKAGVVTIMFKIVDPAYAYYDDNNGNHNVQHVIPITSGLEMVDVVKKFGVDLVKESLRKIGR